MHKTEIVAVMCVIHDVVAGMDGQPLLYINDATAMRSFKQQVNMPSDYMVYHAPNDFQLVKITEMCRDDAGELCISIMNREVLLTGAAAVDTAMRDGYLSMAAQNMAMKGKNNAS